MKKLKIILTFIIPILIIGKSHACTCRGSDIETETFNHQEEVFIGTVIKIERFDIEKTLEDGFIDTYSYIETTFEARKKWKGSPKKYVTVFQKLNSCAYDFSFFMLEYLVTASNQAISSNKFKDELNESYLTTSYCALNIGNNQEEKLAKAVKKLNKLFPNEIELQEKNNTSNYWLLGFGLIITFLLTLILSKKIS